MKRSLLVCAALLVLLVGCGEQGLAEGIFGKEQVIACPPAEALEVERREEPGELLVGGGEARYTLRYDSLEKAGIAPEGVLLGDTLYLTLVELPEDGKEMPRVLTAEVGARGICGTVDIGEGGDAHTGA